MTRRAALMVFSKVAVMAATLATLPWPASVIAAEADPRRSGTEFMGESTRALQRDDTQNPGMLWVSGGETQWNRETGQGGKSCASCHADAAVSMRGVARAIRFSHQPPAG
jgi:sulfur-oxidizing protein SoxA